MDLQTGIYQMYCTGTIQNGNGGDFSPVSASPHGNAFTVRSYSFVFKAGLVESRQTWNMRDFRVVPVYVNDMAPVADSWWVARPHLQHPVRQEMSKSSVSTTKSEGCRPSNIED